MADACGPSQAVADALGQVHALEGSVPILQLREQSERHYRLLQNQFPEDLWVALDYQTFRQKQGAEARQAMIEVRRKTYRQARTKDSTFLYAASLVDTDTRAALSLLGPLADEGYAPADLLLGEIQSQGVFANMAAGRVAVERFFQRCPDTFDRKAFFLVSFYEMPALARQLVARQHQVLDRDDQGRFTDRWPAVWTLEFALTAPEEHPGLRRRVESQASMLMSRFPGRPETLNTARIGFQMSGNTQAQQAFEQQVIERWPASELARDLLVTSWNGSFASGSIGPKARWHTEREFLDEMIARYPDDAAFRFGRLRVLAGDANTTAEQLVEMRTQAMKIAEQATRISTALPPHYEAADQLMTRGVDTEGVGALVQQGAVFKQLAPGLFVPDTAPAEVQAAIRDAELFSLLTACEIAVRAAVVTKRPELTTDCVRKARALSTENRPMEVRRLALIGEHNSAVSDRRAATVVDEPSIERSKWQRREVRLPDWSLRDVAGKTLRSSDYRGRVLLINIWATWCGSCRAELPLLEELQGKLADRDDMAVLTFNVDTDMSSVEPFLRDLAVRVPTMFARTYVQEQVPGIAVPRNIIVDADGWIRWEQLGYVPQPDWTGAMFRKLSETATQSRQSPNPSSSATALSATDQLP